MTAGGGARLSELNVQIEGLAAQDLDGATNVDKPLAAMRLHTASPARMQG